MPRPLGSGSPLGLRCRRSKPDRVAFLAYRILSSSNDSLHAYPKCMGLRACLDDASRIIKLTGRTLTT